jgi:hypothetical protein
MEKELILLSLPVGKHQEQQTKLKPGFVVLCHQLTVCLDKS